MRPNRGRRNLDLRCRGIGTVRCARLRWLCEQLGAVAVFVLWLLAKLHLGQLEATSPPELSALRRGTILVPQPIKCRLQQLRGANKTAFRDGFTLRMVPSNWTEVW